MRYKITNEVSKYGHQLIRQAAGEVMLAVTVLGGDRAAVCDEAIVAFGDDDQPIGMTTISPNGEDHSGQPEIVGVFVLPDHQKGGVGLELLIRAFQRCNERDFTSVRMSVISTAGRALVEKLPEELPVTLDVTYYDDPLTDLITLYGKENGNG